MTFQPLSAMADKGWKIIKTIFKTSQRDNSYFSYITILWIILTNRNFLPNLLFRKRTNVIEFRSADFAGRTNYFNFGN